MRDNIKTLIDHAMELSDDLNLEFCFYYAKKKDRIAFKFYKNDVSTGIQFTLEEINSILDIQLLKIKLTEIVCQLLDKWGNGKGC